MLEAESADYCICVLHQQLIEEPLAMSQRPAYNNDLETLIGKQLK